jgi:peptide/nickel transport system ATP-binding protein
VRFGGANALTGVELTLRAGRVHALVGESGAGKSTVGAVVCAMAPPGAEVSGSVLLAGGTELVGAPESELRAVRGRRVALVPQAAASSLTPVRTVGSQLREAIRHLAPSGSHTVETLLCDVGLAPSAARLYPHQLSGGMAARVALAFALIGGPEVIVADEPTASLDPDLAQSILALLRSRAAGGAAVLLITHDVAAALAFADDATVLAAGCVIESGVAHAVLGKRVPTARREGIGENPPSASRSGAALELREIAFDYGAALFDSFSLRLEPGAITGLRGPSGAGKTTLARIAALDLAPRAGRVLLGGTPMPTAGKRVPKELRRRVAWLQQAPRLAAAPRMTLAQLIAEPLRIRGAGPHAVGELAARVGLPLELLHRRPAQVSGGQLQRAALARALAQDAPFLICDEPTASLDAETAETVVQVLRAEAARGVGVLVISHDRTLLDALADEVVALS